jgi:hypothetical protein
MLRNWLAHHTLPVSPVFVDSLVKVRDLRVITLPGSLLIYQLTPLDQVIELILSELWVVDDLKILITVDSRFKNYSI